MFYIVTSHHDKKGGVAGQGDTVRVTSSKLVTAPGSSNPKAVVTFYEDFLCPACGNFERTFGPTMSKLIDAGAVAADYSMVAILDSSKNQNYSSRVERRPGASPTSRWTRSAVFTPRCSPPRFNPMNAAPVSRTTRN